MKLNTTLSNAQDSKEFISHYLEHEIQNNYDTISTTVVKMFNEKKGKRR
jgi:hypothetical protein